MTLGKAREHVMSRKMRKLADMIEEAGQIDAAPGRAANNVADANNFRSFASTLDLTILSLGIWRDAAAIEATGAYKQVKTHYDEYLRHHPGLRV